jgi:two-component system LytT family response regulator
MRALIVDDERLARATMRRLLEAHPAIEVVGEADSVEAASHAIAELSPDVLFLDVQMPGGSGFDLFDRVDVDARVIFVTAYHEHAINAFEVHALDYLLKPVSPDRLAAAVARLSDRRRLVEPDTALQADDLVCLPVTNGLRFFRVRDITHITAADDYTEVHLSDGALVLSGTAMRSWQERLPESFVRVHRSAITNVDHIDQVVRLANESYSVHLRGIEAPIAMSRRHAAVLKERLGRNLK